MNTRASGGAADIEKGAGGTSRLFLQELLGRDMRGLQSHLRGRVFQRGEFYQAQLSKIQEKIKSPTDLRPKG